jgi:hypothetical protein
VEAEAPEAVAFWWKLKRKRLKLCCSASTLFESCGSNLGRFLLTKRYLFQILIDVNLNYIQVILVFLDNDVRYFISNCMITFQKEKQNWKHIRKWKRYKKRLLSAGSGGVGNGSA